MAQYPRVPTGNNKNYTLDAQISAGASSLTLNQTVAGVVRAPGYLVIDRIDSSGNVTATKREYKYFTGVSGANLTGLTNSDGTDQVHAVGAIVEFVPNVGDENDKYSVFTTEHSDLGQHASLPSLNFVRTGALLGLSQTSLNTLDLRVLRMPSGASGLILQSFGNGLISLASAPVSAGTGGFNAMFQIPGGLASQANIGGLVPVPTSFTAQFVQAFVQTPASVASVSFVVKKNLNTVFAVGTILAGATFTSSASISSAALVAGDNLTLDINSTASLATDLSVLLRAV